MWHFIKALLFIILEKLPTHNRMPIIKLDKVPTHNTIQYNTMQYNTTQRNATQRNATQRKATQRNAKQRNATQRIATQYNTIQYNIVYFPHITIRRSRDCLWVVSRRPAGRCPMFVCLFVSATRRFIYLFWGSVTPST